MVRLPEHLYQFTLPRVHWMRIDGCWMESGFLLSDARHRALRLILQELTALETNVRLRHHRKRNDIPIF